MASSTITCPAVTLRSSNIKNDATRVLFRNFLRRELYEFSNTYEYRLRLQPDTPNLRDPVLDMVFQSENVGCGRLTSIHNGQGVLAGDANRPSGKSLTKAGMFDQPG